MSMGWNIPEIGRRSFLKGAAAASAGMALAGRMSVAAAEEGEFAPLPRGVIHRDLPEGDLEDQFALAAECGFEGIESNTVDSVDEARRMGDAAQEAGIEIHSIMFGGWGSPLSHPDEDVARQGREELEHCIETAEAMGAGAVLLVPGIVNAETRYVEAWDRSTHHIREVLPVAEDLGVVIAVENVWNNFLLSPLEFAEYVDQFESPYLQAYFDVGNIVAYGWPQDWIRTLGERIVRVHYKDFQRDGRNFVNLGEGDVDWIEVRRAFEEVGFDSWVTPEVGGGDEAYLTDLAERMHRINIGEPPLG